jgi:hypothetical protein
MYNDGNVTQIKSGIPRGCLQQSDTLKIYMPNLTKPAKMLWVLCLLQNSRWDLIAIVTMLKGGL